MSLCLLHWQAGALPLVQLGSPYATIHSPTSTECTGDTRGKEPACQYRRCKRCGFDLWVGKMPWRRAWQPTPVFLPGESHGKRSLVGYSPWGHKELDTTEPLTLPIAPRNRNEGQRRVKRGSRERQSEFIIIVGNRGLISLGTS